MSTAGARPARLITSASNPRLKGVVNLRRRRAREGEGLTLVEGYAEVQLALRAGARLREVYYCPALMVDRRQQQVVVDAEAAGADLYELGPAAFAKVAYREGPDGFLAVADAIDRRCSDLDLPDSPLILLCEGVEKPGNLGAMLRTADAAGLSAVLAANPATDWGNPNVVRASKGTVFSVPVARDTTTEILQWLAARAIPIVATTPSTDVRHTDISYRGPLAIAVGAERDGLSDQMLRAADQCVRIPMMGQVNSLNVSTSAAIVVYEAVRQRGLRGHAAV